MRKIIAIGLATALSLGCVATYTFTDRYNVYAQDKEEGTDDIIAEKVKGLQTLVDSVKFTLGAATDQSYYNPILEKNNELKAEIESAMTKEEATSKGDKALTEMESLIEQKKKDAYEHSVNVLKTHIKSGRERSKYKEETTPLYDAYEADLLAQLKEKEDDYSAMEMIFDPLKTNIYDKLVEFDREVAKRRLEDKLNDLKNNNTYTEENLEKLDKLYNEQIEKLDKVNQNNFEDIDSILKATEMAMDRVEKTAKPTEEDKPKDDVEKPAVDPNRQKLIDKIENLRELANKFEAEKEANYPEMDNDNYKTALADMVNTVAKMKETADILDTDKDAEVEGHGIDYEKLLKKADDALEEYNNKLQALNKAKEEAEKNKETTETPDPGTESGTGKEDKEPGNEGEVADKINLDKLKDIDLDKLSNDMEATKNFLDKIKEKDEPEEETTVTPDPGAESGTGEEDKEPGNEGEVVDKINLDKLKDINLDKLSNDMEATKNFLDKIKEKDEPKEESKDDKEEGNIDNVAGNVNLDMIKNIDLDKLMANMLETKAYLDKLDNKKVEDNNKSKNTNININTNESNTKVTDNSNKLPKTAVGLPVGLLLISSLGAGLIANKNKRK